MREISVYEAVAEISSYEAAGEISLYEAATLDKEASSPTKTLSV